MDYVVKVVIPAFEAQRAKLGHGVNEPGLLLDLYYSHFVVAAKQTLANANIGVA